MIAGGLRWTEATAVAVIPNLESASPPVMIVTVAQSDAWRPLNQGPQLGCIVR